MTVKAWLGDGWYLITVWYHSGAMVDGQHPTLHRIAPQQRVIWPKMSVVRFVNPNLGHEKNTENIFISITSIYYCSYFVSYKPAP